MASTLYLHVGLPKSGTTYVQAVLGANKRRLAQGEGLLFPGPNWGAHVRAARDILDFTIDHRAEGAWDRLVDEVRQFDGRAGIISMEWLGGVMPPMMRRIMETLDDFDVRVIFTARDLARSLPGAWQEFCQNRDTFTWSEFLATVTSPMAHDTPAGSIFWNQQDLTRQLARWRDHLPAESISVVTVQQPGQPSALLWDRFCEAVGIEHPTWYDSSGGGKNQSLGLESAELMRRVNERSDQVNLPQTTYLPVLKEIVAKEKLAARKPGESSLGFPEHLDEWLIAQQRRQAETVRESGVRIIGDLDDLVNEQPPRGQDPSTVDAVDLLDAAIDGLVGLAGVVGDAMEDRRVSRDELRLAREREDLAHHDCALARADADQLRDEVEALRHDLDAARREAWEAERRSLPRYAKRRVVAASEHSPSLGLARRAWWKAADSYRAARR